MVTPFEGNHEDLTPIGKYILIEITKEETKEKVLDSGIIVPAAQRAQGNPTFALVKKVGDKVEIGVTPDDFVQINAQLYPDIVDAEGYGRYQLVHEEQIAGVYKHKS